MIRTNTPVLLDHEMEDRLPLSSLGPSAHTHPRTYTRTPTYVRTHVSFRNYV